MMMTTPLSSQALKTLQPLDAITLGHLANELNTRLTGAKINRIQQSTHDDCLLHLWQPKTGEHHKFYANVHPKHPFCCILEKPLGLEIPKVPLQLCVLLRKYLTGARLRQIKAIAHERALILDFENTSDIAERVRYAIIIELMGKTSNLLLVDTSVNVILGTAHGVSDEMSRRRSLRIGDPYAAPPRQANRQPVNMALLDNIKQYWQQDENKLDAPAFLKAFSGISGASLENINTLTCTPEDYYQTLQQLLKANVLSPCLLESGYSLQNHPEAGQRFDTVNSLLATYYATAFQDALIGDERRLLSKRLNKHLDKMNRRVVALNRSLAEDDDSLKLEADETLQNAITDEKNKAQLLSAQKQYTQYKKLKLRQKLALEETALLSQRQSVLEDLLFWTHSAKTKADIALIESAIQSLDWLHNKRDKIQQQQKKSTKHPLLKFTSPTSQAILWVGKSSLQNDYLLRNVARQNDLWCHIQAGPGGHVLLQSPVTQNNSQHLESDIHLAAQLAVYYSPQLEGENVPVVATLAKHVKRVAGGPAGLVQYKQEETYFVTIDDDVLEPIILQSNRHDEALAQGATEG